MSKRLQPAWSPPLHTNDSVLKLYNSLTRQKEVFVPQYGNRVLWYSCGPTVYDASHMGHARSYISFDILRRILSDYFGYDVLYVMNITNIDDKIIKRARQNFLYEKYVQEHHELDTILEDVKTVLIIFEDTVRTMTDNDKKIMLETMRERVKLAVENLEQAVKTEDKAKINGSQKNLLTEARDPLSDWLDKKYGATVTENVIFN